MCKHKKPQFVILKMQPESTYCYLAYIKLQIMDSSCVFKVNSLKKCNSKMKLNVYLSISIKWIDFITFYSTFGNTFFLEFERLTEVILSKK